MGLRVLINDIWGYDIEIEKYQITGNTISGKLKIIFFDHFGLDDNDIKNSVIHWMEMDLKLGIFYNIIRVILKLIRMEENIMHHLLLK